MAWLYVKYIRSVYYEQEHPLRYNAISALIMAAVLLLVLRGTHDSYGPNPLQYALTYAIGFSAIRSWQTHRPKARWRFRRWTLKHPTPDQLADPLFVDAMLGRRPLPRGRALAPWCGRTLLTVVVIVFAVGCVLEAIIPHSGAQPGPIAPIIALACALPTALLLRLYWPPIRDWPRAVPELGWYADPTGRHELRYWNGVEWTEQVVDRGARTIDPFE